jgi:hypothetical protein
MMKTGDSFKKLFLVLSLLAPQLAQAESVDRRTSHHEAFRSAFELCLSENNLARPEPGKPPNEDDRAVIDSCLASKGLTPPPRRGGRPPGPPPEVEGRSAVESQGAQ